tara:strand:+ start:16394 stop:22669 length:6276 start_codon:yes stop_codon:yes gene_type:complete
MARFVAYAAKLDGKQLPTPHIVSAFGASAWDIFPSILDNPEDNLGTFTTNANLPVASSFIPPSLELVGVQPRALQIVKSSGTRGQRISGANLSKFIKRIEYKYLQNAHTMIRVLIDEDAFGNVLTQGDVVVFEANGLLASGSQDSSLQKKSVFFTVNLPFDTSFDRKINVEKFLYGSSSANNFGDEVQLIGTNPNSITWNTSRSLNNLKLGAFGDNPTFSGTEIFPYYASILTQDKNNGQVDVFKFWRRQDVIRNLGDTNFYQTNPSSGTIPMSFQGSGDTFNLRDYHSVSDSHNEGWGREYGSFMYTGPTQDHPYYQILGETSSRSAGLDTISDQSFGAGLSTTDINVNIRKPFFYSGTLKKRNIFWPEPIDYQGSSVTPPAHQYYINFFELSGVTVQGADNHNIGPFDGAPLLNPNYGVSYAIADAISTTATSQGTTVSQLPLSNITGVNWLNLTSNPNTPTSSPLSAINTSFLSWQEYVAAALFQTCTPFHAEVSPFDIISNLDNLNAGRESKLRTFSTSYARSNGLQTVLNASRGNGFEITSANYPTGDVVGFEGPALNLNLYTVFLYADRPADKEMQNADLTFFPNAPSVVASGTEGFGLKYISASTTNTNQDLYEIPNTNDVLYFPFYGNPNGGGIVASNTGYVDANSSVVIDPNTNFASGNRNAINTNSNSPSNYNRGNFSMSPLIDGSIDTIGQSVSETELESIFVMPRQIDFYDDPAIQSNNFVPSVYYNKWYLGVQNTSDTVNTANTVDGNSANIKWKTSANASFTHTLASLGITGTDYLQIDEFYREEYSGVVVTDNVFTFEYIPGRHYFTEDNEGTFFIHDAPEQARSFFTLTGGSGTDNYNTHPLRQILGFSQDQGDNSDIRKAHADLSFTGNWETESCTYSVITNKCDNDIADVDGDAPQVQKRKFVVIAAQEEVEVDNGGNQEDILGCMDATAINYNSLANVDNGDCWYCTDVVNNNDNIFDWLPSIGAGLWINAISFRSRAGLAYADQPLLLGNEFVTGGAQETNWAQGNVVNGYNPTANALTNNGGNPNSASTIFGFGINTNDLFGGTYGPGGTGEMVGSAELLQELISFPGGITDVPAFWTFEIYNFDDSVWGGGGIPSTAIEGSNGWIYEGVGNVYIDDPDAADPDAGLTVLGLNSATIVTSLAPLINQIEGTLTFKTHTGLGMYTDQGLSILNPINSIGIEAVADFGLKAGSHYVGLIKFNPTGVCPGTDKTYYFPINFWIEYCACTDPVANNLNPGTDAPWNPDYLFPAVNTPETFCTGYLDNGNGGEQLGLCTYDPEITTNCDMFLEWCLSNPVSDCIQTGIGTAEVVASLDVLIDGFFDGTEIDQGAPYTLFMSDGTEINFIVNLYEGTNTDGTLVQTVPSHIDGEYNPDITLNGEGTLIDSAVISFNDLDGGIYTVELVITSDLTDYVVDAPCGSYYLTIDLSPADPCDPLEFGCTDPTAINFDQTAVIDDGTCEYISCEEIFDIELASDLIVNSFSVTNTTDTCETVEDGDGDSVTILTPQNSGSFTLTIQDSGPSISAGNFNVGYVKIVGAPGAAIESLLQVYENNTSAIQTGEELIVINDPHIGGWLPTSQNITGATTSTSTTFTVSPMATSFAPGFGLPAGTYMILVVPFIPDSVLDEYNSLDECLNYIATTANDQLYLTINTVQEDCPTPCNEFVNPEDCPNAVGDCTDPEAENYNPDATFDNGSCIYCADGDFEICDCYPTLDECQECDESALVSTDGLRGFGAGFRDCHDDEVFCCTDPSACNYDPSCIWGDVSVCEYESCDEDGCQGEDCDDEIIDECPDPNNPACDEDTYCVCCPDEDGNLPLGCGPNEEDCVILGNCGGPVVDPDGDPEPEVPTVDFICDPILPGSTPTIASGLAWLGQQLDFMSCTSEETRKMMFRLRSGVEHDKTDLIKLSLITYLFNKGSLDCLFDCNNYERANLNKTTMKPRNCLKLWKSSGKKHFAGTSSYKKGELVKYFYISKGGLKFKYFFAGEAWYPGMELPNNRTTQKSKLWIECENIKAQAGANPENYFQTFYEFMIKFCNSCEVVQPEVIPPPLPTKGVGSINTGLIDEEGNEIIF